MSPCLVSRSDHWDVPTLESGRQVEGSLDQAAWMARLLPGQDGEA